jgi:signal peptidase I
MSAASRVASTSALVALVLATVWLFWPSHLGGGTTYLATHGASMEPEFRTGDLAVLSPADEYEVGDVVAYDSESLNTVVMHRIVSGDAAGFTTQGDNNDWLDEDTPTGDEILGRLLVRIPRGGIALDALTSPGAVTFLVAGLLLVLGNATRPRGRGQLRATGRRVARRTAGYSMPTRSLARQAALGSAAVALVGLVGGGVLFALPSTQTDTRSLQVTQEGAFSYAGAAERGITYPSGSVETGDTVWTNLARQVTVSYATSVIGPELSDLRGTLRLDVSVTASDGWNAVVESGLPVTLADGAGTATVTVTPSAAAALLSRHHAETGSAGGGSSLAVLPVVELAGRVAGQAFTADPPAGLSFTLDASALRPVGDAPTNMAAITQTTVQVEEVVPRTIPVLDLQVPIGLARLVAAGILVAALLVLAAGAWVGRTRRGDAADQFIVRHADRILPVAAFHPGPTVFDVADAESLHRVAERFDTVVLHHAAEDEDVFAVRDGDATYRFVVPGVEGRHRGKPPVPAPGPMAAPEPEPVDSTRPLPRFEPAPVDTTYPLQLIGGSRGDWPRVA